MAHIHKLETWRDPATKRRAVIAPIHGAAFSVSVLIFEHRKRYACEELDFWNVVPARQYLTDKGYGVQK